MPALLGFLELLIAIPLLVIGLLGTIFWVWMLIDCLMKESNQGMDKLVWVVVILFTHAFGALLYFFFRRPKRKRELGA